MHSTETVAASTEATQHNAAATFFASVMLPLRHANARRGVSYFATAPEATLSSYWELPRVRGGGIMEVAAATNVDGELAAVAAYWHATGDRRLASLLPDLVALRVAMLAEPAATDTDGQISISVYPLF